MEAAVYRTDAATAAGTGSVIRGSAVTPSVMLGLCLQAVAVWIAHKSIRGEWLRRPGALLLGMAVLGHGITEVMQWVWPGMNRFRAYVSQAQIDAWVILVSATILLYAIAYALIVRRSIADPAPATRAERRLSGLRLRWLLLVTTPLLILTWQGRGALQPVAPGQQASRDHYASVGLAGEFLVPLIAVIGAVVLIRYGSRWLIPTLTIESLVLVAAGTRSMIVTACLLTLVGAALRGVVPSRRQTAAIIMLVTFFTFVISATRAAVGRETFTADQGASERLDGLTKGLGEIGSERSRDAILDDLVYRFDENSYGAMILQAVRHGTVPIGLASVGNAILLVVPSFLAPEKLSSSLEDRNEEAYLDRQFGISQAVDWLPGVFGAMVGWLGPWGLLILGPLLGVGLAAAETFALRRASTSRWLVAMGLAQVALLYASGPQTLIVLMRGPVLAAAAFGVAATVRRTMRRRPPAHPLPARVPTTSA